MAGIAAQLGGFTTVTMYGALGPEGRKHILNQTEAKVLVTTADLVVGYLEVESKLTVRFWVADVPCVSVFNFPYSTSAAEVQPPPSNKLGLTFPKSYFDPSGRAF